MRREHAVSAYMTVFRGDDEEIEVFLYGDTDGPDSSVGFRGAAHLEAWEPKDLVLTEAEEAQAREALWAQALLDAEDRA